MSWQRPQFTRSLRFTVPLIGALGFGLLFGGAGWLLYRVVDAELEAGVSRQSEGLGRWIGAQVREGLPKGALAEPESAAAPVLSKALANARESGLAEDLVLISRHGVILTDATGEAVPGFKARILSAQQEASLEAGSAVVLKPELDAFGALRQSVFVPLGAANGTRLELRMDPRHFQVLTRFRRAAWWAGFVCLGLSALLGLALARWIQAPLEWMRKVAARAEAGEAPSEALGRDDELARSVQAVAGSLDRLSQERLEAKLRREHADKRFEEARQMAAGIAHEVRNPLAVLRGQLDLMHRASTQAASDPAALSRPLERAREQLAQLDSVVSRFLELSRQPRLERSRLNAAMLIERLKLDLQQAAPGPAWQVEAQAQDGLRLHADGALLAGALLNLGLNAWQAMAQGGTLKLRLERQGAWAQFSVQDQGPGFSAEALAHLFEPFFTTKAQGLGLGLALAQRAALAHGGELHVDNAPEGGARIRLSLPLETV